MINIRKWLVILTIGSLVAIPVGIVSAQTLADKLLPQGTEIAPLPTDQQDSISPQGQVGKDGQVGEQDQVGEDGQFGEQSQAGEQGQVGEDGQFGD
jgi:hypothetical protein